MPNTFLVAYYRVSTARQSQSGLGLDAQHEAVQGYLGAHPECKLIGEYTEVESGKRADRPQLLAALAACKRQKAMLVIAKLDRLARNVAFIANLMDGGVEFVAVDNPHASRLMLHMLAAFAEHEREQIGSRTKAALAAAKARGVKLGQHGQILAEQRKREASGFAQSLAGTLRDIRQHGITTIRGIQGELNRREVRSKSGGSWHLPTVFRLLQRVDNPASRTYLASRLPNSNIDHSSTPEARL